jgi:hypothetical protein
MSRCTGRYCIPASKFKHDEDPEGPFRYKEGQCAKECAADSDLCKTCISWKTAYEVGKKDKWHGYIHGEIPAESHIEGSEWNLKLRAKYAEKIARAAMGESNAAPKAKKAAKKALEAVVEAKEARMEAVSALKEAEAATNAVVAEVMRKSSSPKKAKTERKARTAKPKTAKKSPSPSVLGLANFYTSSSSPKPKTAKPKTERKPRTSAPARRKTAKKNANMMIYRPASASGSPMGTKNYAGYATPYSGSPVSSSPVMGNSMLAMPAAKPSSPNSGSNYSAGSNLLLQ